MIFAKGKRNKIFPRVTSCVFIDYAASAGNAVLQLYGVFCCGRGLFIRGRNLGDLLNAQTLVRVGKRFYNCNLRSTIREHTRHGIGV